MHRTLYILILICYTIAAAAQIKEPGNLIKGVVVNQENVTLPGATIQLKNSNIRTTTRSQGTFSLYVAQNEFTLVVSYIGYKTKEVPLRQPLTNPIIISLIENSDSLKEVIVSTGYQQQSRERATGSFSKVDNKVLDLKVSTDILSRLQNEVPGLIFNTVGNGAAGSNSITIRGQSTIYSNTQPLIVIDNFPYEGDLNDINPNDVESITVLKDAGAASIWGSRAGNGVIVITTKKGKYGHPTQVSFNSSVTIGQKPNLFYQSRMSSADYIDVEKMLYNQGYYQSAIQSSNNQPLTPVVNLLLSATNGTISTADANAQIEALAKQDVRNDFEKYFYRKSVDQQYSLNISGGASNQKYYLSAGYDKNLDNLVNNGYDRVTLNGTNTYGFLQNKLELTTAINFTNSKTTQNNSGYGAINMTQSIPLYPYARLADDQGHPLATVKDYNTAFIQSAEQQGLLDWLYKPLDELRFANNTSSIIDYRINTSLSYKILPGFSAQVLYQYENSSTGGQNLQSQDSYFTRNLINNFTQVNGDGTLTHNIPLGSILDLNNQKYTGQNFRGQLNFQKEWLNENEINAIAGYEVQDQHTTGNIYRLYGYDSEHAISGAVPYGDFFEQFSNPGNYSSIPNIDAETDLTNRYLSYYANAAYTYKSRYILSGSARFDQSNLFGVKTNQKGVPLWSAGLAWNISKESFYKIDWLPYLKLRTTYGYNGNVNTRLSAYTTASYQPGAYSSTGLNYAYIDNPPNPDLRWERVQIFNLGIDFSTRKNILSGTLEYYNKKGLDLIGETPYPPSSGITDFTGNTANTAGNGVDLNITSHNFDGQFKWYTSFIFSYVTDKVTNYATKQNVSDYLTSLGGFPLQGKPLYAVYSYSWAGLDPQNGNPRGYLNGVVSEDYSGIIAGATTDNIIYNGPARPTKFGSLRNTFTWRNISLSANISYRFEYYFRRNSVNYTDVLNGIGSSGDYESRWQNPGDENHTNVPSMPSSIDNSRDEFYLYSSALIAKADNIRLQDINLSYSLNRLQVKKLPFSNIRFYLYMNNVGILWKAYKGNLDPDYATAVYPPGRTLSLGIKADL
jgi:TonB-linked SusC/RagA family outer membrane protein